MEFRVDDTVLYGTEGVCRIAEISEQNFMGEPKLYYVLKPVYAGRSTVFVPLDNEALTAKMRRVLSPEEIYTLIRTMPSEEALSIDDDHARRDHCRAVLNGGDRAAMVGMIKALYLRKQRQETAGRKFHVADEHFLHDAEKILYDEFAHVLQIKRDQVLPFILEQIEIQTKA
ncbi:MAG: CarD family transcriptional regulator [Clostridia bacterium]|nr:CarD family transcriptional regulator [Clostridia bacterium]